MSATWRERKGEGIWKPIIICEGVVSSYAWLRTKRGGTEIYDAAVRDSFSVALVWKEADCSQLKAFSSAELSFRRGGGSGQR